MARYTLYLLSAVYLGLDQQYSLQFDLTRDAQTEDGGEFVDEAEPAAGEAATGAAGGLGDKVGDGAM